MPQALGTRDFRSMLKTCPQGMQRVLTSLGAELGLSWWMSALGLGLGLLLAGLLMAALIVQLGGGQQNDPRRSVIVPILGSPPYASTTTSRPTTSTEPGPLRPQEELLAVCCHHVTAFGVRPNSTWGTASLEQQALFQKWGCDRVVKSRFGTLDNSDVNCRSLGPPTYTFYIYRVTGDTDWPIYNVNAGSLGGVLWYLHNEVIVGRPRKFGITRMRRFKVQVAGTRALERINMTFGVRFAYDTQVCTGAGPWASPAECDAQFEKYGYFVGCNNLGTYPFPTAAKGFPCHYPEAVWYSLPKGGRCHGRPTGEANCTYSYEESGDILLDELVGIKNRSQLPSDWTEYDINTDEGYGFSWWDHKFDDWACRNRWQHVRDMWARKFPGTERDDELPAPSCDFTCSFYPNPPLECTMPQPTGADACSTPEACGRVMESYHAPHVGHYRKLDPEVDEANAS
jgi:hypothetical protein